ncbi:hypothetical protein ABZ839_17955 [Streptomyces cellulosae]
MVESVSGGHGPRPGGAAAHTADDTVAEGVEAVQEPCSASPDQTFVVRPD